MKWALLLSRPSLALSACSRAEQPGLLAGSWRFRRAAGRRGRWRPRGR